MEIFQLNNVSFTYPDEGKPVLKDISLTINQGDFLVLCGASGSGKTTLLRLLKQEIAPFGNRQGDIVYMGKPISEWNDQTLASDIGFVFQDPDNQIVMVEVMQEIVFGMENLNIPSFEMKKRLAELVHFFGIDDLLLQNTSDLSGGQKQTINLLSILLLRPKVLLLDEPTSQLDPVAAKELIQILERLNNEMGMTIIIVEHRLEELFSLASKVIMLADGEIVHEGSSQVVAQTVFEQDDERFMTYLPSVTQLYLEKETSPTVDAIPLNVKDSRLWMQRQTFKVSRELTEEQDKNTASDLLLEIDKVYFQYEKDLPFVLKNCSLQLNKGEFFSLVGGNGSGKSTLLRLSMGLLKQQRGKVSYKGKQLKKYRQADLVEQFAYLPQHPLSFYIEDTIEKEMDAIITKHKIEDGADKKRTISERLGISSLLHRHPNDLSGGELQRATLACLLLENPDILFIDEPTKGLDPISKDHLAHLLLELQAKGLTIFMVTHDVEFAVKHVDRCAMLFDGNIAAEGTPSQLFKGNYFYTTAINRATMVDEALEVLTLEEALQTWQ